MHRLAVYVNEGLLFERTYLYKTLQILTYVFDWLYFTRVLLLFPLSITFLVFVHGF